MQSRWTNCSLTTEPLDRSEGGVVICRKGHMYNKEAFLDFILREGRFKTERTSLLETEFGHLKSLKDATAARVNWLDESKGAPNEAGFSCPLTGIEANGRQSFVILWRCGCVLSERVLIMTQAAESSPPRKHLECPQCGKRFTRNRDIVMIHPEKSSTGGVDSSSRTTRYPSVTTTTEHRKRKLMDGELPPSSNALPCGWQRVESKSHRGKYYYRNEVLGVTQWNTPDA
jgi:hypothetical protein